MESNHRDGPAGHKKTFMACRDVKTEKAQKQDTKTLYLCGVVLWMVSLAIII